MSAAPLSAIPQPPPAAAPPSAASPAPAGGAPASVSSFNRGIKALTVSLYNLAKTDATIWRAKERVVTAVSVEPLLVINLVGPYLYKYKDQIYSGDDQFFVENDYGQELRDATSSERKEVVMAIIPKMKAVWQALDPDTKLAFQEGVVGLLDDYIEYLAARLLPGNL